MKAAVFHKSGDIRYENFADPRLEHPRDAVIRVTAASINGSDLHIFHGNFPQARQLILGQEFCGVIEELGTEVGHFKKGDRVAVPFSIACGRCYFCRRGVPTGCELSNKANYGPEGGVIMHKGGGLFGYSDLYGAYHGGQAQYVRVPFADYGLRKIPDKISDEEAVFLGDILPAAWAGVEKTGVQAGDTVAVFGCGALGIMVQKLAKIRGASRVIGIDVNPYRLQMAKELAGAEVIDASKVDAAEVVIELTQGHGADICVDAVGMEARTNVAERISNALHVQSGTSKIVGQALSAVRRGGSMAILGMYATSYDAFPLGQWMDKGVRIWAGQAPVHNYIDLLMGLVESQRIRASDLITHRFSLDQIENAYAIFSKRDNSCLKVLLRP